MITLEPELEISELNIVITVLGAFIVLFGFISVKIKQVWYLGEALPAVMVGILLGPIAAMFLDVERWGSAMGEQMPHVTLGICRVVIGVQLVIAGFQLPAKYQWDKIKEMLICLLPVMTIMWLCTTACIMLTIPKLSVLSALVIGSCVTCTDPILSQAVAKGPFSDKYVPRALREIISSEAGANDGFGFPFLLLAVYLIRHADLKNVVFKTPELAMQALNGTAEAKEMLGMSQFPANLLATPLPTPAAAAVATVPTVASAAGSFVMKRAEEMGGMAMEAGMEMGGMAMEAGGEAMKAMTEMEIEEMYEMVGRMGGGVPKAMEFWFVQGWLYVIFMSVGIAAVIGFGSRYAISYGLKRKWIDGESFLLWPTGVGLFTIGVCGILRTDDLLACFFVGNFLNWNGLYLEESEKRHDETNSVIDVILNFGGFMYIGTIIPWKEFQMPDVTGITVGRLILLGVLIMFFRRLPAIFITYKFMPKVCTTWKEALFMGWFGPIGIGAVFYVETARTNFPKRGFAQTQEEEDMLNAMIPVVYWLVFFSIIFHGLSIPALNMYYVWKGIPPIQEDDPAERKMLSENDPLPNNAYVDKRGSIVVNNRFSRPDLQKDLSLGSYPTYDPNQFPEPVKEPRYLSQERI